MGYNISRFSVNRNRPQLDQLLVAKGDLRFETSDPRKLSYKIREALMSAKEFEEFKHYYDTIFPHFTLREESNAVVAIYHSIPIGIPLGTDDSGDDNELPRETKGTISEALSMLDIIGGGIEGDKEGFIELFFPNARLNPSDQNKLHDWTQTTEWKYIDHGDKGVTLTKDKDLPTEIFWEPEG